MLEAFWFYILDAFFFFFIETYLILMVALMIFFKAAIINWLILIFKDLCFSKSIAFWESYNLLIIISKIIHGEGTFDFLWRNLGVTEALRPWSFMLILRTIWLILLLIIWILIPLKKWEILNLAFIDFIEWHFRMRINYQFCLQIKWCIKHATVLVTFLIKS